MLQLQTATDTVEPRSNHHTAFFSRDGAFLMGSDRHYPEEAPAQIVKRRFLGGLDDQAAVHIAYRDAEADARSAGRGLPTEAELEFAAHGGREAASDLPAPPDIVIPREMPKDGLRLCAPNDGRRCRTAARHAEPVSRPNNHVGFRGGRRDTRTAR